MVELLRMKKISINMQIYFYKRAIVAKCLYEIVVSSYGVTRMTLHVERQWK